MQLANATSPISFLFDSQHAETVKLSGMAFDIFACSGCSLHNSYTDCTANWLHFTVDVCRLRCHGFLRHFHHYWLDYVEKSHHRDQVREISTIVLQSAILRLDSAGDVIFATTELSQRRRELSRICRWSWCEFDQTCPQMPKIMCLRHPSWAPFHRTVVAAVPIFFRSGDALLLHLHSLFHWKHGRGLYLPCRIFSNHFWSFTSSRFTSSWFTVHAPTYFRWLRTNLDRKPWWSLPTWPGSRVRLSSLNFLLASSAKFKLGFRIGIETILNPFCVNLLSIRSTHYQLLSFHERDYHEYQGF